MVKKINLLLCSALLLTKPVVANEAIEIYAAGSLREAFTALHAAYQKETELNAKFLFGPSGKLRERIEAGSDPAIFASASKDHVEKLVQAGKLRSAITFASNKLCVLAKPQTPITEVNMVKQLLDPKLRLATSTPGADPAGDYTWQMFRLIENDHANAFAALEQKALKLVGADISNNNSRSAYADALVADKADAFITYCTNASTAKALHPSLQIYPVPEKYNVVADYSLGLTQNASDRALHFVRFVQRMQGQKVLAGFGFSPPRLE